MSYKRVKYILIAAVLLGGHLSYQAQIPLILLSDFPGPPLAFKQCTPEHTPHGQRLTTSSASATES